MSNKNLKKAPLRVILPITITVALFVMTIFLLILPFQKNSLMERKRETIRKLAESAWSTLAIYEAREKSGLLSHEQAQARAIDHLRNLRYGSDMKGYFWINDMHSYMIMHPLRSDVDRKDVSDFSDPRGKKIFKDFVKIVKENKAGFVRYLWEKEDKRIVPKLSYVKGFEPWSWIVGTGLYLEDVEAEIAAITRKLVMMCLGILIVIVFLCTYVIWQGIRYENECKGFERVLKDSERRFRTIIENSGDIIYRTDPNGFITYINPACERLLGYKQEELLGRFFLDIIAPPFREIAMSMGQDQWKKRIPSTHHEQKILTKAGEERWVSQMTSLQMNSEWVDGYQAIVRDIHEKKCAEQEILRAKEAAEEATRAKSQFLANMSHEIRTPLNGVVGMANLLRDTELTAEQYEYIDILLNSSDTLLELINDILDYSKIEAGKLVLEPIPFDLHIVVEETLDMLAPKADEKGIEIILRYVPGVARRFTGDAGRIRQILLNLLNNAIKFTERGHVLINVECEEIDNDKSLLRISVEDTGIGIPEEKLEHIFWQFSQADASTTRKYGGSGLGLAISKQLVDLMDGNISVKSKPGEGATFSFMLPLIPGPEPDVFRPSVKPEFSELKDLRIMIVDDNSVNRRILEEYLAKLELSCDSAASGKEALILLRAAHKAGIPYNIMLMDYLMPEMDGEALARMIKADPDISCTVLIMLTSAAQRGDVKRMANAGISAYIVKPVRDSQLAEILSSAWEDWNRGDPAGAIITSYTQRKPVSSKKEAEETALIWGMRILLVEDNIANQKAGAWMLEKIGCYVDTALNGLEALEMLDKSSYDLVFMDLQMPEMDGYEATKEIRERETKGKDSESRIPIIAMTANVMKDNQKRCMEIGMDDYICKPVRKNELLKILSYWRKLKQTSESGSKEVRKSDQKKKSESLVFNSKDALSRYDGEVEILKEIIDDYLAAAPEQLEAINASLAREELATVSKVAHSLKGGASYIGAERLRDVTLETEIASKAEELEKTRKVSENISKELELFQRAVNAFTWDKTIPESEVKKTQELFEDIKKELESFKD